MGVNAMIFMSQSGLTDPSRETAWDAWYIEHLRIMKTVTGISSAQRFKTRGEGYSPSLAMYSIASENVFRDPYYLSVRSMGEWKPLIDERFYKRNLISGLDVAPPVAAGQILIVADRSTPDPALPLTWLTAVALDKSTAVRGIRVIAAEQRPAFAQPGIGIYEPVTL
jgi:hypothetical protein